MLYYKGFDENWKCNNFQFEIGKEYTHQEEIKICKSGFHACKTSPFHTLRYGNYRKFAEVECETIEEQNNKIVTNKIKILREITLLGWLEEHPEYDIHTEDDLVLRHAASCGHHDVVKYLVEHGADVHVQDDLALRWAASCGHYNVVKYLVEHGANIHAQDNDALEYAIYYGHLEIVEYLESLK